MLPKFCIKQNNKELLPVLPFARIFNERISGKQFNFLKFSITVYTAYVKSSRSRE